MKHMPVNSTDLEDCDSELLTTASSSFNGAEEKTKKNLRNQKPPGYASEIIFIMVNMFMLKFYD